MPAHHCEPCKVKWPAEVVRPSGQLMSPGALCPLCGERTALLHGSAPVGLSEAKHMIFDVLYARREEGRKGPSPEEQESLELAQAFAGLRGLPEAA
jgi:hypothetical protein